MALLAARPDVERDLELAARLGGISLGQLERHEDYDLHVARLQRQAETCPEHGGPLTECADPDKPWYPQRHICRATMELAAADRRWRAIHEALPFHDGTFESWAKEASTSHPYRFDDGVRLYVAETDIQPDDDFLSPPRAKPEGGDDGD